MISYHVSKTAIVLNYGGRHVMVPAADEAYEKVLQAIREERLDDIPRIVEKKAAVQARSDVGRIMVEDTALPIELADKIAEFELLQLSPKPLLSFWERLRKNPDDHCRKNLYKFVSFNGIAVSDKGTFIAYKKVRSDYYDHHSGTVKYAVGSTVTMDRNKVDSNPQVTCSRGLHAATHSYATDFNSSGVMLAVEIDPVDVVCVPNDYDGTKLRVCRMKVLAEVTDQLSSPHYTPEPDAEPATKGKKDHAPRSKKGEQKAKPKDLVFHRSKFDEAGDSLPGKCGKTGRVKATWRGVNCGRCLRMR